MDKEEMFRIVKEANGITGNFQDGMIRPLFEEVLNYLEAAGVSEEILNSEKVIGTVSIGVSDLWNPAAGKKELSSYFKERAIQLALSGGNSNV